jgi:hypothetical protein
LHFDEQSGPTFVGPLEVQGLKRLETMLQMGGCAVFVKIYQ